MLVGLTTSLSDVGAIDIADLCWHFQRVVSMSGACRGHADMVPTVSRPKGPRQPQCRRHVADVSHVGIFQSFCGHDMADISY